MALQLCYVTHSEIGLVRKNNQDSGFASPTLLVVADGMGGAAAGDLASAVAIDTIKRIDSPARGEDMLDVLAEALQEANDRIADLVDADRSLDGMGTTVTGVLFDGTRLGLAHIGDSRAYLWRDETLARLTHDHSWVQSLVDDGKISEAEAAVHPHRSLLLKVLNGHATNDPDLAMVELQTGDRLMLCSDGLCGLVDDPEIAEALAVPDPQASLDRLVADARAEGGIDNITVILADVIEAGVIEAGEVQAGATPLPDAQAPALLGAAADRYIPPTDGTRADATPTDEAVGGDPDGLDDADDDRPPRVGAPAAVEDEARYNPQPPLRRRFLRPLVGILVLVLVVGAGLGTAYAWTRTQYFVGASGTQVAIFQGLSESLPGVHASRVFEVQQLAVSALPPYYQEKVRAKIDVASLESARETVAELSEAARRCAGQSPSSPPTPTPTPKGPTSQTSPVSRTPVPTAPASASATATAPSC